MKPNVDVNVSQFNEAGKPPFQKPKALTQANVVTTDDREAINDVGRQYSSLR